MFTKTLGQERMQLKPRPACRRFILKEKLIPDIVRVGNQHVWDGRSSRCANGERTVFTPDMPPGVRQEMRRLARIGFFGNLDLTILDWFRYSRLREMWDKKRSGVSDGISLWVPRRNRGTTRTLKRKR
jgi:hypothetical protein